MSSGTVAFELDTSESVVRFVALGFGAALVPSSAVAMPTDVHVLPLSPDAGHPIALMQAPRPSAPGAHAFLGLMLATDGAAGHE